MSIIIGWDIGGAHLKAARVEKGVATETAQTATPLWRGLDVLERAFEAILEKLGQADAHVVTMTGELSDAFASRHEGVVGLATIAARKLAGAPAHLYAGRSGFVAMARAAEYAADIASANWHASAALVGRRLGDALLIDVGSTTTDLVPIVAGKVLAIGYADADRMAAGELVYTGAVRSAVSGLTDRAPFRGVWTPLMNEFFATAADVHRFLGDLPDGVDLADTADGRAKTIPASQARLARMIGRDATEARAGEWAALAAWFAETQLRAICDAAFLRLSRGDVPADAPIVAAGAGASLARETARRLRREVVDFDALVGAPPGSSICAPAVAVACLAAEVIDGDAVRRTK